MARLSQTKSARLAGCSRATIANRIKDGLLTEHPDGVDIADLVRVFPDITADRVEQFLAGDLPSKSNDDSEMAEELAAAKAQAAKLQAQIDELAADKEAEAAQRLAANSWAKGLSDRIIEQQAEQLKAQGEQLMAKDQTIEKLSDRITALLPAPPAQRKKIFGIF